MNERNDLTLLAYLAHDVGVLVESDKLHETRYRRQKRFNKLLLVGVGIMTLNYIRLLGEVNGLKTEIEKLEQRQAEKDILPILDPTDLTFQMYAVKNDAEESETK